MLRKPLLSRKGMSSKLPGNFKVSKDKGDLRFTIALVPFEYLPKSNSIEATKRIGTK